jgi:hypothetical protein
MLTFIRLVVLQLLFIKRIKVTGSLEIRVVVRAQHGGCKRVHVRRRRARAEQCQLEHEGAAVESLLHDLLDRARVRGPWRMQRPEVQQQLALERRHRHDR